MRKKEEEEEEKEEEEEEEKKKKKKKRFTSADKRGLRLEVGGYYKSRTSQDERSFVFLCFCFSCLFFCSPIRTRNSSQVRHIRRCVRLRSQPEKKVVHAP